MESRRPLYGTPVLAEQAGRMIGKEPYVQELLLVGSLAFGQPGHDIDLVVVTDEDRARRWLRRVRVGMERHGGDTVSYPLQHERTCAAGYEVFEPPANAYIFEHQRALDIYVLPPDWREKRKELEAALGEVTPAGEESLLTTFKREGRAWLPHPGMFGFYETKPRRRRKPKSDTLDKAWRILNSGSTMTDDQQHAALVTLFSQSPSP